MLHNSPIRYDVSNIPKAFKVEINNRFLPLLASTEEEATPNTGWEYTIEAIQGVAQDTIPRKKVMKKP